MQRAAQLFSLEETSWESPFVDKIWHTHSVPAEAFVSVAATHWEMVVTKREGRAVLTVRGPETRASSSLIPQEAEFFGIQFALGTFMPRLPPGSLVDAAMHLRSADRRGASFILDGSTWETPEYHNADVFIMRLVRAGLLVHDDVIAGALQGDTRALSVRSVQRRFLRATGLSRNTHRQIARAEYALTLLERGSSILDAVEQAGYSDQPHLTRALTRFIGQTPAQIVRDRVSFPFKTPPARPR